MLTMHGQKKILCQQCNDLAHFSVKYQHTFFEIKFVICCSTKKSSSILCYINFIFTWKKSTYLPHSTYHCAPVDFVKDAYLIKRQDRL